MQTLFLNKLWQFIEHCSDNEKQNGGVGTEWLWVYLHLPSWLHGSLEAVAAASVQYHETVSCNVSLAQEKIRFQNLEYDLYWTHSTFAPQLKLRNPKSRITYSVW